MRPRRSAHPEWRRDPAARARVAQLARVEYTLARVLRRVKSLSRLLDAPFAGVRPR